MIIQSKRVYLEELWTEAQIEIKDKKIVSILPYGTKPVDYDYGTDKILPGFIDTHCHGALGFDTNDVDEDGLKRWLKGAADEGITSLCPTTITQSEEVLTASLKNVAKVAQSDYEGARIVGIHFEGPYLNKKFKGAQPESFIVEGTKKQFNRYYEASNKLIKIITMATENDPEFTLTKYISSLNIAINIGHSASTYEEALFALANGVSGFTHTFNGMSPFNHRAPGLMGASMIIRDGYSEIITDGVHVSFPVIKLLFEAKGKDHVVIVTDSVQAKKVGVGHYVFGGQNIEVKENGGAYLESGNLAGSTLLFNRALENVIAHAQVNEVSAINAATINPAKVLRLDHIKGRLRVGYDADIVVLNDAYDVQATYVEGKCAYTVK